DRILEIGTGSGYQAAVLGEITKEVFSVEIIPSLAASAEKLLQKLGYKNVRIKSGDGFLGWKEHAPYDGIIVTCAPKDIPAPLIEQLREGGRLVIPVGEDFQNLKLGEKKNGKFIVRNIIPVRFVPMTGMAGAPAVRKMAPSFEPGGCLDKWGKIFGKNINTGVAVSLSQQKLFFIEKGAVRKNFPVSTSKYGIGSLSGSNKTPLGTHAIYKKTGEGAEEGIIFKSLINTRRKARIYKDPVDVPEDFVTTRVMALEGMEKGLNKGGDKDSLSRRIYIHGTPEEGLIGRPASHGCVRMKNSDVIELFNLVSEGMPVEILE
ncbi:MAG: protein-L-isoaspartate O-methyltransferase, partial [Elusimicrobiota bacterium]|nr:protein-L-isoaspartate O-methyltransferase [Elusimicrobiota bacterium]